MGLQRCFDGRVNGVDRAQMSNELVWPHLVRPAVPILYLDLNHWIYLAKVRHSHTEAPKGYADLWDALSSAVDTGRVVVPLSAQHLWEVHRIADPRQRRHIADVMETIARFQYLLGRVDIGHLEIEAGIRHILGEPDPPVPLPLIRATIGQALGLVGGIQIVDGSGQDVSERTRREMGTAEYEAFLAKATLEFERGLLAGPPDEDVEILRAEHGYAPEVARASGESRLAFEQDLSEKLSVNERWRRGRLRDVVSAREFTHEWLDLFNRINRERVESGCKDFDVSDAEMIGLIGAMPHSQVAISLKTRYHRNARHRWTANDIVDIDAVSVAFAYCDAVFTDKAARHMLMNSPELRSFPTELPKRPADLVSWLSTLETRSLGADFLISVSRPSVST